MSMEHIKEAVTAAVRRARESGVRINLPLFEQYAFYRFALPSYRNRCQLKNVINRVVEGYDHDFNKLPRDLTLANEP